MRLILISKAFLTGNAWSFTFSPEKPVIWIAGQFVKVGLLHPNPDNEGPTRRFTIAAAPHEKLLTITTRLTQTTFKQALAGLPLGRSLEMLDAPAGDFVWRPSARPHLFTAQGIGITPFYAIIKDRIHRQLSVSATLLYGHQPGSEPIFDSTLAAWAKLDPTFEYQLLEGFLTPARVADSIPDYHQRFVYVSGPKSFVGLCLPPHQLSLSQLKQDNFPGYASSNY